MAKVKHTKNELRKQKHNLNRFERYLPTLVLKKQQLQMHIQRIQRELRNCESEIEGLRNTVGRWVDVFAENIGIEKLITIENIEITEGNIAGVDIPMLDEINFKEEQYSFFDTPLWVDYGIEATKKSMTLLIRQQILVKQSEAVKEELRITNQRVNLFEKVKIPETKENIRRIRIYLGDMETAAVVTGKIAKEKLHRKAKEKVLL